MERVGGEETNSQCKQQLTIGKRTLGVSDMNALSGCEGSVLLRN